MIFHHKKNLLAATITSLALGVISTSVTTTALASSHREAPFITSMPKVDGSDFYMFRSYETGREDHITLIANYYPLQAAYGGPNYFDMENDALYQIHIDNNGDAVEDITYSFRFQDVVNDLALNINGTQVSVPLKNIGVIGPDTTDTDNVYVRQTYTVDQILGDRRSGGATALVNAENGSGTFRKPMDNIGNKSISNYPAYADAHIYNMTIPGCSEPGKVFVGQREDPFSVNLGEIFDLVNTNPLGPVDAESNVIDGTNVLSIALEVPTTCLTQGSEDVIGAWTTASIRQARVINPFPDAENNKAAAVKGGAWTQVSRLGMPLVNEIVIGLKDKDSFNASEPKDDTQFATYVTNPTMPALLEILYPGTAVAPNLYPRTDLVEAFLTGLDGLNQPANVVGSEMLRLNTNTPAIPALSQSNLGALDSDAAGFPNGRRPGDDVVDIVLRVAMGALITDSTIAPNNTAPLTDGATIDATEFSSEFPYILAPTAGSIY